MQLFEKISKNQLLLISLGIIVVQIIILKFQGHVAICECGYIKFWHGAINSNQDSQHITDWYSLTHILHGFIFYYILNRITNSKLSKTQYFILSLGLESGWEILENSSIIINRYRRLPL